MQKSIIQRTVKYAIALVWVANGLFAKVLHLVPRHEEIVARILGPEFSKPLTILIGISEIGIDIFTI